MCKSSEPRKNICSNDLVIFTSDENKAVRYVLRRADFTYLFLEYLVIMLVGIVLLGTGFTDWGIASRERMSDALNVAWLSSPSLCGCASYYIRMLYRICYRLNKRIVSPEDATFECERINRVGTIWYFVTRAVTVPTGAYMFLLLLSRGITGLLNISGDSVDEYVLAGLSYLLGVAGGRLLSYLLNLGASALPKSSAPGSEAMWRER